MDAGIPVFTLTFSLRFWPFWALSRYSGCWVALKTTADTIKTSASLFVEEAFSPYIMPDGVSLPSGGLNIRQIRHLPKIHLYK